MQEIRQGLQRGIDAFYGNIWGTIMRYYGLRPLHYKVLGERANIQPGDNVLEIGMGSRPYFHTQGYCDKAGPKGSFTGVDNNPSAIQHARDVIERWDRLHPKAKRSSKENLLVADARQLPFKDATFDKIIVSNITSIEGVLAEAYRVLKPGGQIIVSQLELPAPIVSWFQVENLHRAGFENINVTPGLPTLPLGLIFPLPSELAALHLVPMLNWIIIARKHPELPRNITIRSTAVRRPQKF